MKKRFLSLVLTGVIALCLVACTKGEITSTEDIEEVSVVNADPSSGIKCDKAINEVAFNIVNTAYNNAAKMKNGTVEMSWMDETYDISAQASLMQDQETDNTMFYYTEQSDEMFAGYLYRYNYKGAEVPTTVYVTTKYGWLETESVPPYNVDPLEVFASEDYTYSKVFEEPVSFLGEAEDADSTKYYTLLSAGVSKSEDMEDIVRYSSVYVEKETMLPIAMVIEYVDISEDAQYNLDTGETVEHIVRTEVALFTFNNDDISEEVTMNPEYDNIIDEQTYLAEKAKDDNEIKARTGEVEE